MTRHDIIDAIKTVKTAIEQSDLETSINHFYSNPGRENRSFYSHFIQSLHAFSLAASKFGSAENTLINIFSLEPLIAPKNWATWISEENLYTNEEFRMAARGINQISDFLPPLLSLLEKDYEKEQPLRSTEGFERHEILRTFLSEDSTSFSTPERLIELLQAVSLLYETIAEVDGFKDAKIVVAGCDSGSEKSFDFLGVAKLIEQLKELLLAVWDRVIFFREKQIETRIDLVAKSLPILERISHMEAANELTPEKAEILRRNVHLGVSKFLDVGGSIPEMAEQSSFSPRQLLHPKPKLLMAPIQVSDSSRTESPSPISGTDSLSTEEKETLKNLLNKLKPNEG